MEARREIVCWAAEQIRPEFTELTWDIFWKTAMQEVSVAKVSESSARSIGYSPLKSMYWSASTVDDHVMAIHCVDEWQGIPYLVITYSRGVSL